MEKAGFLDRIGRENVCADIESSLERAREILAQQKAGKPHAPPEIAPSVVTPN